MDQSKIGQLAAELMDNLPHEAQGNIIAVGIVVVVDDGVEYGSTYTRVKTTTDRFYEQLGLFQAAIEVVKSGIVNGD